MRLLDMTTFAVLVRNRHFGRTAEEMNTTQPAVSSRLAAMEAELGCRLIHRAGSEFRLTPEGEQVLVAFQGVLRSMDLLKASLKNPQHEANVVVRIGAIDSVIATWMPDMVESLHLRMPNLKVELTVESTKRLIYGMNKGEFDLIFAVDPAIGDGFRSFVSCVWQMIWAASPKIVDPDRIHSVDELANMPIITFPKNTPPYRQIAPYFQDEQVLASKLTSSNSLFAIIKMCMDGLGVAAIPSVVIERELGSGLLNPMQVAKRFPPLPIIATYQSSTEQEIILRVVSQAQESARKFCGRVNPSTAWLA
ncbi:MAG: LysR family transcriptional regulator [Pseudomonadota bacterium]|uniref:LysR family transcriptional regulator n=2 Tax=Polaromonas TaxID=52972 RepID=A0ABW1TX77_9BURK